MTSIPKILKSLRSGKQNLHEYLQDVKTEYQQREPDVLAFVPEAGRFDRLRQEAQALLDRYPTPADRPPLFGLLVGVKDIFHVDGFATHAGSKLPPEALAGTESEAVTALRKAGALIMGKTVTTEFAYFGAGATRNPHNLAHTPGGSSSGSAAAVGAKICPLTFGTQTIGSINRPASFCGAVGYKPSYDRISRAGVIPLAPSLDHIGIFAEDIAGISHIAPFLTDQWQQPAITDKQPVLGVPIGLYLEQASSEAVTNLWQTVWDLRKKGVIVTKVRAFPDLRDIVTRHRLINAAEAAQVHAQWYDKYKSLYHPKTVELIERGQAVSPDALAIAKTGQSKLRQQLTTFMDKHQLDLWLAPAATGTAPLGLTNTGNPVMNLPWSHSGLPALNFPNGKDKNGLPFGLQLVGRWYEDEKLIAWAKMIQKKISE